MHVRIDSAGRIVVPKSVRERLGLKRDSELELEERAGGIVLRPVKQGSALVRDKRGWLVFNGTLAGDVDWDRLVEEDREARMDEIAGDLQGR